MPELPEVETTRRGIEPHMLGRTVRAVLVREPRLRWPVSQALASRLTGQRIVAIERRAKYLLLRTPRGTAIVHLGMSGSLRIVDAGLSPQTHDHVDLVIDSHKALRLRDPRRFGALLWCEDDPYRHPLLAQLGPEPLGEGLTAQYLLDRARGRRVSIKDFVMNSRIIAGVGNIYANEALFEAGIRPARAAGRLSAGRYGVLVGTIRTVLERAIGCGGTTLRDFVREDGAPGYFSQQLKVYGREGKPCSRCGEILRGRRLGQRSTFYCPRCQR
jgi:formamidopyrimidine-DNA glycosylase